jgi:hypothetical protein
MKLKDIDWHTCTSCEAEFKVISDTDELVEYCPYCSALIEIVEDDDEAFFEDDDD